MFNLFKKKDGTIKIIDKVVMSQEAKLKILLDAYKKDNSIVFIGWFDETIEQLNQFFSAANESPTVLTAREAAFPFVDGKNLLFVEHYPIHTKEQELLKKLKLTSATVYSSLTEPLFKRFGSDKIINLMKQMGMKEDEVVEHKMITQSVRAAQDKIAKTIEFDRTATSQQDWLEKNLPTG